MKKFIASCLLGGGLILGSVVGASAAPAPQANCTAVEATTNHDISFFARLPHDGGRSFVGNASSSNCGSR